ncbi:hypothetical protein QCA50_002700 [Cerrena zonata]|uniref:Uncharacterized protein n=1 Tax=Cerrena zonata TaxID=2478898 RepID=A0AAW0GMS3_9APHY
MPHASFFRVAHARDTRVTPLDIVYKWPLRATPPSPHLVLSPPPAYLFPDLKPLILSHRLPFRPHRCLASTYRLRFLNKPWQQYNAHPILRHT